MRRSRKAKADGGRRTSAVRSFLRLAVACVALPLFAAPVLHAQSSKEDDSKEEDVPKLDPYTRGERAAFDKAGYYSLGPFPIAEGIQTRDVEECLGGIPVQWIETEHFRLGSTLKSYKFKGDPREERKIKEELERLSKRLARYKPPQSKIDPWLRSHLYAQRVEEQYQDFQKRFGFADADFAKLGPEAPGQPGYLGEGPFLGQESKFVVLLFEKTSGLGRFVNRYLKREETPSYREWLPGGGMLQGTSVQTWKEFDYELDATLHCIVASDLAHNLVDGFRKSWFAAPQWFKQGLGHWYARRADERFVLYATGTAKEKDDDSWRWEPRIRGLVGNRAGTSWADMLGLQRATDIKSYDHMILWSRVDWLLSLKDADLRAFLLGLTDSMEAVPEADRAKVSIERQKKALLAGFQKTPEELEEAWRRHVLSRYPRN